VHVMAINGSPRTEKSSTNHILAPLLEGMRAAGATTELVHLGHLQIKPCLGCFLCWIKTFTWYGNAQNVVTNWSNQFVQIANRRSGEILKPASTFSLKPW